MDHSNIAFFCFVKAPWGIAAFMGQIKITEYDKDTIHTHTHYKLKIIDIRYKIE